MKFHFVSLTEFYVIFICTACHPYPAYLFIYIFSLSLASVQFMHAFGLFIVGWMKLKDVFHILAIFRWRHQKEKLCNWCPTECPVTPVVCPVCPWPVSASVRFQDKYLIVTSDTAHSQLCWAISWLLVVTRVRREMLAPCLVPSGTISTTVLNTLLYDICIITKLIIFLNFQNA